MSTKSFFILMMCFFIISAPVWGLDLKPGKYEITATVQMPGMPGMPPQTTTQCMTKKNPVPDGGADSQGCKVTHMKTSGNTVTYTMECDQQGKKMTATGKMVFSGSTFEGNTQMTMGPEAGGMTITTQIKGKRIGACK